MAKRFPLEIVIAATDKATAVLQRVANRIDRFQAPFQRLSKSFSVLAQKSGLKGVGEALKNVSSSALQVGRNVAVGMTLATAAIGGFIFRNLSAADAIGDTAARLTVATDALQAYQFGFQQADVDQQAFVASLDTLNRNLGLAKIGLGKAVPLFRGLGLDPRKFKTVDALLPALADRLSRVSDPAKRAAIASRLLGDAGAQMAVKLAEGPKALEAMMTAARRAGVIISGDTIEAAGRFDARWKALKATFQGVAGNAMGRLYPALIKLAEALQRTIVKYQPQIEAFASQFAGNLPKYIENVVDALRGLGSALEPIANLAATMVKHFGAGNSVLITLAAIVGGKLIVALLSLGSALAGLGVSMSAAFAVPALIVGAVVAAVAAGWWLYKNWDKVTAAIGGAIEWMVNKFKAAWQRVKDAAVSAFQFVADLIERVLKNSPIGLLFRGLQFLGTKLGETAAASFAAPAPVATSLLAPQSGGRESVEVKVDLSNLPPGTRTSASASGGVLFDLNRGFAMPGVR